MFEIYKKGQGTSARWVAAIGLGGFAVFGAYELEEMVSGFSDRTINLGVSQVSVSVLAALVGFVAAAVLIGLIVNSRRVVDYLIMSEVELRKVSWPTREELKRQTIVVIAAMLFFSAVLLAADVAFILGSRYLYGF